MANEISRQQFFNQSIILDGATYRDSELVRCQIGSADSTVAMTFERCVLIDCVFWSEQNNLTFNDCHFEGTASVSDQELRRLPDAKIAGTFEPSRNPLQADDDRLCSLYLTGYHPERWREW